MRDSFAQEMHALADQDPRVVLLSGDIGNRMFDSLKETAGDRFFNCGIAEQSMMGIAGGLALSGMRPVVYTITPFVTYRCFEQIRVDASYHEAPITIVGTGAGLSYASLGPTHHSMEDIAILRTLPNMTVFCPSGPDEVRKGLRAALKQDGPVYIRLGKKGEPDLYDTPDQIVFGKAETIRAGDDVCIIGAGPVLSLGLEAAEALAAAGISARVENFHTIKPLDTAKLEEIAGRYKGAVVLEEHGRIGGLYGAVAEWYADRKGASMRIASISSKDEFLHNIGGQDFARNHYGITVDAIVDSAKEMMSDA